MFEMLLGVSGVGGKGAINILSTISPAKFSLAVVTNDAETIRQAPGVGPKLAQRIILELKDKFKGIELSDLSGDEIINTVETSDSDALNALLVLGYSPQEAKQALNGVDQSLGTEEAIKSALKNLVSLF